MRVIVVLLFLIVVADGFTAQKATLSPLRTRNRDITFTLQVTSIHRSALHKSHLFASRKKSKVPRRKRMKLKLTDIWYSTKRWLSRRKRFTVYVLECEHGKYYVGCTTNRRRRVKEHLSEKGGSKWTRIHRPVRLVTEYRRIPTQYYLGKEAQITAELMLEHGVNNVRGAMFAEPRPYTQADIDALTGFLGHFNNLHYNGVRVKLEEELDPAPWTRKSRRRKNKKRRKKAKISDRCFHCGERGHWARDCPETWGSQDE